MFVAILGQLWLPYLTEDAQWRVVTVVMWMQIAGLAVFGSGFLYAYGFGLLYAWARERLRKGSTP